MAFNGFTDRVVQYPGRVVMTPVQGEANTYDMSRAEGNVTAEGTPFNASTFNSIADDVIEEADDKIVTSAEVTTLKNKLGITGQALSILGDILTAITNRIIANKRDGSAITLDSYTSSDYTFPSDGYLSVAMGASATARASVSLKDAEGQYIGEMGALSNGDYPSYLTFVKKGMRVRVSGVADNGHVYFYPIGV